MFLTTLICQNQSNSSLPAGSIGFCFFPLRANSIFKVRWASCVPTCWKVKSSNAYSCAGSFLLAAVSSGATRIKPALAQRFAVSPAAAKRIKLEPATVLAVSIWIRWLQCTHCPDWRVICSLFQQGTRGTKPQLALVAKVCRARLAGVAKKLGWPGTVP